jgi:hypothetical protein
MANKQREIEIYIHFTLYDKASYSVFFDLIKLIFQQSAVKSKIAMAHVKK